jgi:exodeoxyribonuclease VII large subunit
VPRPDLVIVARGGGSIEDLWAFNEEEVVRAVADCSIPIISAVGHETDTSLSDFAADVRAPTPTAAAEIAVPVKSELLALLAETGARSLRCANRAIERGAETLQACLRHFPAREDLLAPQRQKLDELGERLPRALGARLGHARADLGKAAGAIRPSLLDFTLRRSRDRLEGIWRVAQLAHPNRPLERGYARVEDSKGKTLMSAAAAREAVRLRLIFADGRVDATVGEGVEPAKRGNYRRPQSDHPKLL